MIAAFLGTRTNDGPTPLRLLAVLLLIVSCAGVADLFAAEGARVEETVFLPQDFYVGDTVELRVIFVPDGGMRVSRPSEMPVLSWIDFHEVSVLQEEGQWQARIRFSSYAPGTRSLPPIELGDVVLDSIKIHTRSILNEESHEFYGIKDQLLVPGTRIAIALIVALLFFGPVLVLNFTGRLHRGFSSFVAARRGRRPSKRLNRVLKELRENQDQMSSRRFYIVLDEELRRYLSERTGSDFRSITSSEFAVHFRDVLPESDEERVKEVGELMQRSDMVKFGGENSDKQRREADMDIIAYVLQEVERLEVERRKQEQKRRKLVRKRGRKRREATE